MNRLVLFVIVTGTLLLLLSPIYEFGGRALAQEPTAADVYQDPEGRFSMTLVGSWEQVETDRPFALFQVPGLDFNMYVLTVETGNLAAAEEAALRLVGVDPDGLAQTKSTKFVNWFITFYSQGGGKGVTSLCQEKDGVSHCLIVTGDEGLTTNPPDPVMKTVQAFVLAGEEITLPSTVEAFEAYINSFAGDVPPGLSIVITVGGDVLYAKGFGMADGPAGMPAEPDTVYLWASMTKMVTATAVMQLVDQDLIDLDARLSDYLDYVPAKYGITVRQLLTHSAGLGEPDDFIVGNLRLEGKALLDPDVFARGYFAQFTGTLFEPGLVSSYSSPGFVLLGQIVAHVSGQSYINYVRQRILTPLGMVTTDNSYSSEAMIAKAAAPAFPVGQIDDVMVRLDRVRGLGDGADFIREVDASHVWMNRYSVFGAGGSLIGPATEVMHFAQMHINGGEFDGAQILSPEAVAAMQEMQFSSARDPLGWGLGWVVVDKGEHPYVEHQGGGVGVWDQMRLYPDDGVAIVLMSNASGFDRDRVVDAAANVVFAMLTP
jgi:CubicO group peptidase (beta-lactamase class C family)